jgi:hypothetical protein
MLINGHDMKKEKQKLISFFAASPEVTKRAAYIVCIVFRACISGCNLKVYATLSRLI